MNHSIEKGEYVLATVLSLLRDGKAPAEKSKVLENYFNDLYKLFVRKLSELDCQSKVCEADTKKLRSLLDEIITVKILIVGKGEEEA